MTIVFVLLMIIPSQAMGITFNQAVEKIRKHESVQVLQGHSQVVSEQARIDGSWGDPVLAISAKNFPEKNLDQRESPMSGVEFSLSQKISLSKKYGVQQDALQANSRSFYYDAKDKQQFLVKVLWELLIIEKRISSEINILKENQQWINKILKVSKKLYANGKISQQAILDIQIRSSEIDSSVKNKEFELSQLNIKMIYLIGTSKIQSYSIPWKSLDSQTNKAVDNKLLSFKEKIKSTQLNINASKLNYIPDIQLTVGVTKRENIDGVGDFVGASVNFPIPLSDKVNSTYLKATHQRYTAVKEFENYKKVKLRETLTLKNEILKIKTQLKTLELRTLKYANNSRTITSKSYELGKSSYNELLQSELKLQNIHTQIISLKMKRDIAKVTLKYIQGEVIK